MAGRSREDAVKALHRMADRRLGAPSPTRRTRVTKPGRVSAVLSPTAALVFLDGSDRTVRVRVPMLPDVIDPLIVGDAVMVDEWSDGTREITRIQGRTPTVGDDTDPDTDRDLAYYEALGLITAETFAEHEEGTTHLLLYNTPNTYATADGWWSQIGVGAIPEQWGSVAFHAELNGDGSNAATWVNGTIRGRIRQQAALGNQPSVTIRLTDAADIVPADVSVVVTSVVDATVFGLYLRVTREYEWIEWAPIWVSRTHGAAFIWTGCRPFTSSLPAGTATAAT